MKNETTKTTKEEKILLPESKPKSLRPMRSMVAVRSLKPKTLATSFVTRAPEAKA